MVAHPARRWTEPGLQALWHVYLRGAHRHGVRKWGMAMRMLVTIGAMLVAGGAVAQTPRTVQQAFDAAAELDRTGTPAARLAAWEAIETRVAGKKRSLAIVRIRKSAALLDLDRKDEAAAASRAGLADLPASDPSLREDRYLALLGLGKIGEAALDYASAAQAYRQADAVAVEPVEKAGVLYGLLATEPYVDPDAAARTMVRAEALFATIKVEPVVMARFRSLNAERLLNRGDFVAARVAGEAAVKLLGGLTLRLDLNDVMARSDVALAALLSGRLDQAREYMAMTGAGRVTKGRFDPGIQMRAPDCGGEAGLKPADLAVIEFSVGADGRVVESRPVYAAGGGAVALEFARAARDWFWTPEQVAAMPVFFRNRVRIEMRCSTAFQRPSIIGYLDGALIKWLVEKDAPLPPEIEGSDSAALPQLRVQLAAAEAKGERNALALVPILQMIARNYAAPREEAHAAAQRALLILDAAKAPATPRLAVETAVWFTQRIEKKRDATAMFDEKALASPAYANDPVARTAIRMLLAEANRFKPERARLFLTQIAADTALDEQNPLRAASLIQLASLEQGSGNVAAARAAYLKSGAEQCAIVDSPPRLLSAGGTFPQEAMRWGFEGWTVQQFDIDAEGRVLNARTVLAYPPFVFSQSGTRAAEGARFSKSYRPDGGLGCGGRDARIRFVLPDK